MMKLSIIIPVYNEERFISYTIEKIKSTLLPLGMIREIVIVDDGSTDRTPFILKRYEADPEIKIYHLDKNSGKAASVKIGIEKSEGDILLIQDADLEYGPSHYPILVAPILEQKSLVVYGSRFKGKIKKMALINRIANIISNATLNFIFGSKLTDVNTGYKVFKREIFNKIRINSTRFVFETEITCKLLKLGYRIYEVPIEYEARCRKEDKKITWLQALCMYWGIIKYAFCSLGP